MLFRKVLADAGAVPHRGGREGQHRDRRAGHRVPGAARPAIAHHHHPAGPGAVLRHPQDEPRPLRRVRRRQVRRAGTEAGLE